MPAPRSRGVKISRDSSQKKQAAVFFYTDEVAANQNADDVYQSCRAAPYHGWNFKYIAVLGEVERTCYGAMLLP